MPEWRLLAAVGRYSVLSPTVAGERTSMDKVKVSRAAASLMARGLLRQTQDPDDGRGRLLRLTRKGATVYAGDAPMAQAVEAALAPGLTKRNGPPCIGHWPSSGITPGRCSKAVRADQADHPPQCGHARRTGILRGTDLGRVNGHEHCSASQETGPRMTIDAATLERAFRRFHRNHHHGAAEEGAAQCLDARHQSRSGRASRG